MKRNKLLNLIAPILSIVLLIGLWTAFALFDKDNLYPTPDKVVVGLFYVLISPEFYSALFYTLLRSLISFSVCFILAFFTAYLSYKNSTARAFFKPIIAVIRALPTVAVVLLLLFFTNSFVAPIIVTGLVVFPTAYLNISVALSSVSSDELEMCRVFNVKKSKVLKKVIIPEIMPDLLESLGGAFSLTLKLMVASEVLSFTKNSIGYFLNLASSYNDLPKMLALVVVTVIISLATEGVFSLIAKRVGKWK